MKPNQLFIIALIATSIKLLHELLKIKRSNKVAISERHKTAITMSQDKKPNINTLLFSDEGFNERKEGTTLIIGENYYDDAGTIRDNLDDLYDLMKGFGDPKEYPFIYVTKREEKVVAGYFDTWRQFVDIIDQSNFESWFQDQILQWQNLNNIELIAVKKGDAKDKYILKINGNVPKLL